MFSYATGQPSKAFMSVDGYGVLLKRPFRLERRYEYETFAGVLLGSKSSTFALFFERGGDLNALGLEENDCFSLLGDLASFDFAVHSDRAKYDFLTVISTYIATRSGRVFPTISLTRQSMIRIKVKWKLEKMATKRKLRVHELILVIFIQLGIMKALIERGEEKHKIERVREILDRSFRGPSKIHRISTLLKPPQYIINHKFVEHFGNALRTTILNKRRTCKISHDRSQTRLVSDLERSYRILTHKHLI